MNPDGSTTFEANQPFNGTEEGFAGSGEEVPPETMEEVVTKGADATIYIVIGILLIAVLYMVYRYQKKKDGDDDFFSELDGEKVSERKER